MKLIEDLKNFALRGNVIDLVVGFTVGAAFTTIAKSLVDDIIMPPVGVLMGVLWLKEPASTAKTLGTLVMLAGLVMVAL